MQMRNPEIMASNDTITEKIAALPPDQSYFSLEFFPPKTEMGFQNLQARLVRMANALRPLFVTVTWGAGGSTAARSLELAEICQKQIGLTTCLHLTCTNMSKKLIDDALREAKQVGIRNILALRGDPPRQEEYRMEGQDMEGAEDFVWAVDLVKYIREQYGDYFCIGVAGYPEGHSDESNPADQDPVHDMPYLVQKVLAGADFIMTQLFYDASAYIHYEKLVREWDNGVLKSYPIIPGLMPIQSWSVLNRVTKLSHARLPQSIRDRLEPIRGNDEEVKRVGVDVLTEMIKTVQTSPQHSPSPQPRGFHFYTLNLEKAVSYVLEKSHLIPALTPPENTTAVDDASFDGQPVTINGSTHSARSRRSSSVHNHLATDCSRSSSALEPPSRATTLQITHGVGSLGREATWDDYPNGRFGDARSPAFGEIDGYGPSLHMSPAAARMKWGYPTSREDVSQLFVRHLGGDLDQLPWSEGPLNAETKVIEKELCALVERGWLSIASQPAVDGMRSSDPVFGWGPRGGFVFQKAFVEFWIPSKDWAEVLRPKLQSEDVKGEVSWYASPCPSTSNITRTNGTSSAEAEHTDVRATTADGIAFDARFESSHPAESVESVTWGTFPGKEIVTPTIIEEISFRAWAEEAFGIWREWERCYPPASKSREVIRHCREDYWLVNVIGQQYQEPGRLWDILLHA